MTLNAEKSGRAGTGPVARVPLSVRVFSPILKALLTARVPLGYNRLVTIRGRASGLPRTTAIAVIEVSGRRWVWAPLGEVNWVRNLRAAGRATIHQRGGQTEEVRATELGADERITFFRDILAPFARSLPFGVTVIKLADGVDVTDAVKAAEGRRVFELHRLTLVFQRGSDDAECTGDRGAPPVRRRGALRRQGMDEIEPW